MPSPPCAVPFVKVFRFLGRVCKGGGGECKEGGESVRREGRV